MKHPAAAITLFALILVSFPGCNLRRDVKKEIQRINQDIKNKPDEIISGAESTIAGLAYQQKQFLKCEDLATAYQKAQKKFRAENGNYAASFAALNGANPNNKPYVAAATTQAFFSGTCRPLQATSSDGDFALTFELDRKAILGGIAAQLKNPNLSPDRRKELTQVRQYFSAAGPCRITATKSDITHTGDCGIAGKK